MMQRLVARTLTVLAAIILLPAACTADVALVCLEALGVPAPRSRWIAAAGGGVLGAAAWAKLAFAQGGLAAAATELTATLADMLQQLFSPDIVLDARIVVCAGAFPALAAATQAACVLVLAVALVATSTARAALAAVLLCANPMAAGLQASNFLACAVASVAAALLIARRLRPAGEGAEALI